MLGSLVNIYVCMCVCVCFPSCWNADSLEKTRRRGKKNPEGVGMMTEGVSGEGEREHAIC